MFTKLTLLLLAATLVSAKYPSGILGKTNPLESEKVTHKVNVADLPASVNWGDMNGENYLTQVKNQHIPQYCGSCWAQSITSVISDRINIMKQNSFPRISLSAQVLLDHDTIDQGCHGGDYSTGFQWVMDNSITEINCSQYRAEGHEEANSSTQGVCTDCLHDNCYTPDNYHTYTISNFHALANDEATLMTEIANNGPISCTVHADPLEENDQLHGMQDVFSTTETGELNHAISLTGYGTDENGKKYWIMRNSWGEYTADQGFLKAERGVNMIRIEEACWAPTPRETWNDHKLPIEPTTAFDHLRALEASLKAQVEVSTKAARQNEFKGSFRRSSARDGQYKESAQIYGTDNLPNSFSWFNKDGKNYLSEMVNQHIPQYCGSCWAQAAVASMSARINIMNNNTPRTFLSAQNLINCGVGSCAEGGDSYDAFEHASEKGIPEWGCMNYTATDPENAECSAIQTCMNCPFFGEGDCFPVTHFTNWKASKHGSLFGAANMMAEIYNHGPIACAMSANDDFYNNYKGGIYVADHINNILFHPVNHEITVVGWGTNATDGDYWVVQNSWGSSWGESGFFRIGRNTWHNLSIEDDCSYVTPLLDEE